MTQSKQAYRGALLNPMADAQGEFSGFELSNDHVVVVDEGQVTVAQAIDAIRAMGHERLAAVGLRFVEGELFFGDEILELSNLVIAPGNVDTHTHIYQPRELEGDLMEWLPKMFKAGEIPAKQDSEKARAMARERLELLAANGTTRVIAWPTSSVKSARIVLEEAEALNLEVRVSFVAMDQNVPEELMEDTATTVAGLEELLTEFEGRIVVIDRFPIAVSSELRRELVRLSRAHGVLYEVHLDENQGEIAFVKKLYDGRSVVRVLAEDGVFAPGMKVGLAHSIHTNHEDRECIRANIKAGCKVFVRACPNSNNQLKSHLWNNSEYVPFPLREWQNLGAIVTMGTDLGAGNNFNLYQEMLDESARQNGGANAGDAKPSPIELLEMGTVNGARSFGKTPADLRIRENAPADFAVVTLAPPNTEIKNPADQMADRLIRGGAQGPQAMVATFVQGRCVA